MGKTLFITDLDGTFLNSSAKITSVTADIINKLLDNGVIFSYATARSFYKSSLITGPLNLKYPAVQHGGTFIQDPKTGEYFDKCVFAQDKAEAMLRKIKANGLYPVVFSIIDGRERFSWIEGKENAGIDFFLKSRRSDIRIRAVQDYDGFIGDVHEIMFVSDIREELQDIADAINPDDCFTYFIQEDTYKDENGRKKYWLAFNRADAAKDAGVLKAAKLVGADKIICFGDNINDLPMFKISDESYAVANALPEIKKIATGIIGSNDDDGVAKWLDANAYKYL